MAYNYIDEKQLKDALHDSEQYMLPFYQPLKELYRATTGKPGKVAPGKPRITTGKLASIRRELPKQVIQQLPTGKVVVKDNPEFETYGSSILTDIILPNANAGGTPYSKAKHGIKDVFSVGSSWMEVFFNRTGTLLHADFRRKDPRDIAFEPGKTSEFDTHFLWIYEWLTEYDIKDIMHWQQRLEKSAKGRKEDFTGKYDLAQLQKLLDSGKKAKDDTHKSEDEKKYASNDEGFYKIAWLKQKGEGATFFGYAPAVEGVVGQCVNPDPRGVIPVHGLVVENDDGNPLGEALAAISVPKQNLADFDMQNYQYGQGMMYDPAVKKWGSTPDSKIQIRPGAVIAMNGTQSTDDFETVDINNAATANFANNYGLLASEIMEEVGFIGGSNVSGTSGNPSFSKTDSGVQQTDRRTALSINDMQKAHEAWLGRIFETALNIHFAESQGVKPLDLSPETMQRMKLDKQPQLNYDQKFSGIRFTVDAGTTKAADDEAENQRLTGLLELKVKYGAQADSKFMAMYNQIVKNSGMDDPETISYSDEELALAKQQEEAARQLQMQQLQQAANGQQQGQPQRLPSESITFKDAVAAGATDAAAAMLEQAGLPSDNLKKAAVTQAQAIQAAGQQQNTAPQEQAPQQSQNPVEADRQQAFQQLVSRGVPQDKAEQLLQTIDQGGQ